MAINRCGQDGKRVTCIFVRGCVKDGMSGRAAGWLVIVFIRNSNTVLDLILPTRMVHQRGHMVQPEANKHGLNCQRMSHNPSLAVAVAKLLISGR